MTMRKSALCLLLVLAAAPASGQPAEPAQRSAPAGPWDPAARVAAQREAMQALAFLDGSWRGEAQSSQFPEPIAHTERVGTLLDGTVRLVEGRGYDGDGRTVFNAFAVISFDPATRGYSIRTHAMGFVGDYPLTVRPDGFSWSHPMGPGGTMRYTATVRDGEWHEVGERVVEGQAPARAVELRVRRIGDSDWPQAGEVAMR